VTVPGQIAPVTVTTNPTGVQVLSVVLNTGIAPGTVIPAGTAFPVILSNGSAPAGGAPNATTQIVTLRTDHNITVGAGGSVTLQQTLTGNVTVNGVTLASIIATNPGTGQGTATIAATPITIPAQTVNLPIPRETTVTATVTRSVAAETKVDQIVDLRGKWGYANTFLGPNWLIYFTGGAAIAHVERTLALTQTVSVAGDGSRTNTFTSTTGDTRLGWVVGGGFDWKMTPNVILGVLYRHHDFPKGTVSFADNSGDNGRAVSFGANRAHVDSVQGRLSWLFPIQ